MSTPLVVKFGGDALASPERIATAARRVRVRLNTQPVVAVASARRGVTDHLLGLVERVRASTDPEGDDSPSLFAASDRAVAAGELVAASLLAVALGRLGLKAQVLDAREAGLGSDGQWTRARLSRVQPARIVKLVERGITPVVTGFQGWHRGQVTTLGRGGSDTTAVALAVSLGAARCELVKHSGGLFSADPRLVPEARLIPRSSHRFLTALAAAGARVISYRAAALAERESVALRFTSLEGEPSESLVDDHPEDIGTSAVASRSGRYRFTAHVPVRVDRTRSAGYLTAITAAGIPAELDVSDEGTGSRVDLLADPADMEACLSAARHLLPRGRRLALIATGLSTVTVLGARGGAADSLPETAQGIGGTQLLRAPLNENRMSFVVDDAHAPRLVHALHSALHAAKPGAVAAPVHQVHQSQSRRVDVSHR